MIREYFDRQQARQVRSRTRKRGYVKLVSWSVLLIAAVIAGRAGLAWMTGQGCFNVGSVTVSGNRLVPSGEVLSIARYWLHKPVWRIDRARLTATLQRRNPAIKSIGYALWPWWTLAVTVRERQAVARIESDPATVVSPEGVFFRDSTQTGLPFLRIAGTTDIGRMRAIAAAMTCPAPGPDWLFDPSDPQDIRVLADGAVIHLGNGGFSAIWGKYQEIQCDLEQNRRAATDIDLRYRDQGIVVLRDSSAAGSAANN